MKKTIISLSILSLAFSACEKVIPIDLPNDGNNLTVNAVFGNDSAFNVHVSGSLHILDNGRIVNIGDANVVVRDANNNAETLTHNGDGWYKSNSANITPGNYTINVSAATYEDIDANSYVPSPVAITNWDTAATTFGEITGREILLSFNDPDASNNFYFVILEKLSFGYWEPMAFYSPEVIFDQTNQENYFWRGSTFTDDVINGQNHTLRLIVDDWYFDGSQPGDQIKMKLYSCSEDYYKFIRTYLAYEQSNGDPFAQPVQVYTNINNGRGLFAGFSLATDSITF